MSEIASIFHAMREFALPAKKRRAPLFRDAAACWLEDRRHGLKSASIYRYRYLLDTHILPSLGDEPIIALSAAAINTFLAEKTERGRLDGSGGLSASYVRSIMLVIQSIMHFAAAEGLCPPLSRIGKPALFRPELKILSVPAQQKLARFCTAEVDDTAIGILLSLYAGLRIGEVCALAWNDIDWERQLLRVRHTVSRIDVQGHSEWTLSLPKTPTSARTIPICSVLMDALRVHRAHSHSPFVASRREQFANPRSFEYRYHKALMRCGVPDINFHALRHTFATRCIEAGTDVKSLSEMLGHADASVTLNIYVHSSMERKRAQLEKLAL